MDTPTDVGKSTRGLCGSDVLFLLSVAAMVFAFVVSLAVIRH